MKKFFILLFLFVAYNILCANDTITFKEIVYGHTEGVALVMKVVKPIKPNGIAVVRLISSGWKSFIPDSGYIKKVRAFTERGQTVFLVSHGSQPRYKVAEILDQIKLAVQFIVNNADQYGIDPNRIGITGVSSGGHLSLMTAYSSSLQENSLLMAIEKNDLPHIGAVGCFCPPSNLLEFEGPGSNFLNSPVGRTICADAFNFTIRSGKKLQNERLKLLSPNYLVCKRSPPTIIIHGDKDTLVPFQQSQDLINSLRNYEVPCRLVKKTGAGHTWNAMDEDNALIADWFECYLPVIN